jgi:Zn-dependent peptidase ImmA (M78 family)
MDPFALLRDFPEITLLIRRLQDGERGRWYPDEHVIVLDDRLSQAERRCVLMHELVHRTRGDVHLPDNLMTLRQEKSCHESVARALIPFASLRAALQWGRDPQELADELWVDVKTLTVRLSALTPIEASAIQETWSTDEAWVVA